MLYAFTFSIAVRKRWTDTMHSGGRGYGFGNKKYDVTEPMPGSIVVHAETLDAAKPMAEAVLGDSPVPSVKAGFQYKDVSSEWVLEPQSIEPVGVAPTPAPTRAPRPRILGSRSRS